MTPKMYAEALLELHRSGKLKRGEVRRFFYILRRRNQLSWLPAILREFSRILYQATGIRKVDIIGADERARKFVPEVAERFGPNTEAHFSINPNILGGVIIKIDDTVIDASVRRQLDRMFRP